MDTTTISKFRLTERHLDEGINLVILYRGGLSAPKGVEARTEKLAPCISRFTAEQVKNFAAGKAIAPYRDAAWNQLTPSARVEAHINNIFHDASLQGAVSWYVQESKY